MARCKKCNVEILDDTDRCPLCNLILKKNDKEISELYPLDVIATTRKHRLLANIMLFVSIVLQTIAFWHDYDAHGVKIMWSLIIGMAIIYTNVVVRLTIMGRSGFLFKIAGVCFFALVFCVLGDFVMGYKGWSIEVVVPIVMMGLHLFIFILMLAHRKHWQSYIMIQVALVAIGVVLVTIGALGFIKHVILLNVSTALSIFMFLGIVIIGDKRAKTELKRRFHM
ncbi:DUF6320 domain-containing protein [Lachnobacterium bovis]|uniref:Zinc ribbon domain-containing protein n=1 Tax=Lachnobacterium bovis TaxID=140626 RepID=A0A1H9U4L0_9FIRM|nr:DUF6320 domain-containing protein [Lachnobacterium bovis]SES04435.1 hypothetical protein SAMN02910429_01933 [Lachnobacterium bovis]